MMSQYLEELEHEPFDVCEFVERLTWRTNNEAEAGFDSELLHESFMNTIKDLTLLGERQQRKCEKQEEQLKVIQKAHSKAIDQIQQRHKQSMSGFHSLDEKINTVAKKIIHLGVQLENVNTPRSRIVEAQILLGYIMEFMVPGPTVADLFSNEARLVEAADTIQKLYTIAQDLPSDRFEDVKKKIEAQYDAIELKLLAEFVIAQKCNDVDGMQKLATILSQFKGYSQCVDAYIEQSQASTNTGKDIFAGIVPMCKQHYGIIKAVFANPEQVMTKFLLNIYQLKLNQYAQTRLEDRKNEDKYLKTLFDLYSRTMKLSQDLAEFNLSTDEFDLLSKLSQNIFAPHLVTYIDTEVNVLETKCAVVQKKFYESKNHQKKRAERFQDFKRDVQANVQALMGNRTGQQQQQADENSGETLLSEELAINLLQEAKAAFKRCRVLSQENDLSKNATRLSDILLQYLMRDHVDYAINLGLNAIPTTDSKVFPQPNFLEIVQKTNTIVHLLEKIYAASIVPCVVSTSYYSECTKNKEKVLETIELKLDTGLDRCITAVMNWVKNYLAAEQKKTDFRPETDVDTVASSACLQVVQQLKPFIAQIQRCMDGENLNAVLTDYGCRLHRVIFEHFQQFQYTTTGALVAICDVNEYRKLVRVLQSNFVTQLFDILHALCNLLLVKHENIPEVCSGETLNSLDKSVVLNFIQLRSDYKTIKLSNALKGITEQQQR